MQWICIANIFMGATILLLSIIQYYYSLVNLKNESYGEKIFSKFIYVFCMALMLFFLAGYIGMGLVYIGGKELHRSDILISSIFFFGAIFVKVVVTVQVQMSKTISRKTDELIRTLVNAMEAKDQYTRGHSVHVANLVKLFYYKLPYHMQRNINLAQLQDAAILHDIGKIGIPDNVLNKPGKLNDEEWVLIRSHPRMGKQILDQTSYSELGNIILCHHERVDQDGYYRIPADQIPMESKMIAIADTFSALFSDRVYRPRRSFEEAIAILKGAAGTQLDSTLTAIFCSISEEEMLEASRDLFTMEQKGNIASWGTSQAAI